MQKLSTYAAIVVVTFLVIGGIYLQFSPPDKPMKQDSNQESAALQNYGPAPEFAGIEHWLNLPTGQAGSEPLTMWQLRGQVVLIDFWTYSCINCIRTLPYVTGWYEKYKDKGFVVVGVHTPEFAFEKDTSNVQTALKRHNINYPVAQDNDYATWNAYQNRYWPAHYLIDQKGNVVYIHFGEGKYQETEQAIQELLGLSSEQEMAEKNIQSEAKTPEIYFGLKRLEYLSENQSPSTTVKNFSFPSELPLNSFALEGQWEFSEEGAKLSGSSGKVKLNFYAKDVHIVAHSDQEVEVKVIIDGQLSRTLQVKNSDLYTLFEGEDSRQRILELQIEGQGFEVFTFTFG